MEKKTIHIQLKICSFDELSDECQQLIEAAKEQTRKSYAPYSRFNVGCAVLMKNHEIIGGNNQENAAYPSGLCAERVAVFYAKSQFPETPIEAIAVAAFHDDGFTENPVNPCGGCLQVLLEYEKKQRENIKLILYGKDNIHVIDSIRDCLPFSFGF